MIFNRQYSGHTVQTILPVLVVCLLSTTTTTIITGQIVQQQTTEISVTTLTPEAICHGHNNSCGDCVSNTGCYYCKPNNTCLVYLKGLHPFSQCAAGKPEDTAYGTCLVNSRTLLIVLLSVGLSLVVVGVCLCCWLCACCRDCRRRQLARQWDRWQLQRQDMSAEHEERRKQREMQRQQIRQKYGLSNDNNNPYSKF
ncbi:pituitary tumor-transforming gene 1 protein-interacting protein-like [Oppia nitens]|uniref:pituitary tumor-transforming gene 1 protein-interacting protein-like n=1 Tax=Oppia nitens TaxID=1686743 RepID=UPI0023DC809D|nr:pituitary tumor-transforming gene 1 protein-interacting protein-like [Oppia nitens]